MTGVAVYRTQIAADWIDYNGHLRDAYYGLILSHAIDALMEHIGLDEAYRTRTGCTLYTLEMHIHYLREVKSDASVSAEVRILGADRKRIHASFDLVTDTDPAPAAAAEVMLMHVRQSPQPASEPFAQAASEAIESLRQQTASLPAPAHGSRQMQLPRR
ncbi:MAG TPA: thioesterase family protein [Steroidobacteraceae bacterium]